MTDASASGEQVRSAFLSRGAWVLLLSIALLAVVFDLASKHVAFAHVADDPVSIVRSEVIEAGRNDPHHIQRLVPAHPPTVVVPSTLEFKLVLNPGAVFGIGPGQRWFFVGFTMIALGFGLFMFARWTGPRDRFAHVALGLLIGGGLGNLYDRVVYACVRDFIHPLPGVQWPFGWKVLGSREVWPYVSNVADLLLLIGIGMLLVHLWRQDRAEGEGETPDAGSVAQPETP